MKIKNITAKQLKSLLQKAYINFYLRPKTIWKWIKQATPIYTKRLQGSNKLSWRKPQTKGYINFLERSAN